MKKVLLMVNFVIQSNYVVVGSSTLPNDGKAYLIKVDKSGNILWQKRIGSNATRSDEGFSIKQTTDLGFIITGRAWNVFSSWSDLTFIKTNTSGDVIWQRVFGDGLQDIGYSVLQTGDSGFISVGYKSIDNWNADVYLVKTDNIGNWLWERTFRGQRRSEGWSIQDDDDGYIIAGYTYSNESDSSDVFIIRIDSLGNLVWRKTFGGRENESGYFIHKTNDGGYIIAGAKGASLYLIKLGLPPQQSEDCCNGMDDDLRLL